MTRRRNYTPDYVPGDRPNHDYRPNPTDRPDRMRYPRGSRPRQADLDLLARIAAVRCGACGGQDRLRADDQGVPFCAECRAHDQVIP